MNTIDGKKIEYLELDGPCALTLCLEEGPHSHPICPDCGAVKFGNLFCPTCRSACKRTKILDFEGSIES